MRIMNNVSSLNAWRNLTSTDGSLGKNLERLSSGFRINRAADDVAGLAISENMRAQIRGFNQAVRNAQDGISLLQTAEGALNETHAMLQRMRELAVQAANGTLQPEDRMQIQTEMDNLTKEVTRITNATKFNNKDLIDGSLRKGGVDDITLQIGPNGGQTVTFDIGAMDAKSLGIARDVKTATVYQDDGNASVAGGQFTKGVDAVGAVGAGMRDGEFTIKYDHNNGTVQLFSDPAATPESAIGTAVKIYNDDRTALLSGSVTIGDVNTAQTITINLEDFDTIDGLGANALDRINVGSRVAAVNDAEADQAIFNTSGVGTGISSVGWGMKDGETYTVEIVDSDGAGAWALQLKDSNGNIGDFVLLTALNGTEVTLGDKATGQTVTFTHQSVASMTAAAVAAAGGTPASTVTNTFTVLNNGQAAEAARFDGGVKYENAQVFAGLNVSSVEGASEALGIIDAAIEKVSTQRAQLGAIQNRLEHTINNLQVVSENLVASESRIRDVDMAQEMATFTKHQILMQAGTAMLAQANAKNQAVLSLLQ